MASIRYLAKGVWDLLLSSKMNIRTRSYSSAARVWSYMILIDSSIMHKIQFVTVLGRQVLLTETVSLSPFLQFRENFQRYTRTGITSRFVNVSIGWVGTNLLVKYVHTFSAQDYVRKSGFWNQGIFLLGELESWLWNLYYCSRKPEPLGIRKLSH